jgi:hypothetical protein
VKREPGERWRENERRRRATVKAAVAHELAEAQEAIQRLDNLEKLSTGLPTSAMTWDELQRRFPGVPEDGTVVQVNGLALNLREACNRGMVSVVGGKVTIFNLPPRLTGGQTSTINAVVLPKRTR